MGAISYSNDKEIVLLLGVKRVRSVVQLQTTLI